MFLNFGLYFRMPNGIAGDVDRFLTRRLQNKTDRRAKRFSQIVVLPDDVRAVLPKCAVEGYALEVCTVFKDTNFLNS